MTTTLLQRLRFGITGSSACSPIRIEVEYSTGETIIFEGSAVDILNNEIVKVMMNIMAAERKEEQPPLFDNDQFRN